MHSPILAFAGRDARRLKGKGLDGDASGPFVRIGVGGMSVGAIRQFKPPWGARGRAKDQWKRGTRTQRGYDNRWARAARAFLRDNPLCVHHLEQGRSVPATEVDHIIPHKGDQALFWDVDNWQSLCKRCHSAKTRKEQSKPSA